MWQLKIYQPQSDSAFSATPQSQIWKRSRKFTRDEIANYTGYFLAGCMKKFKLTPEQITQLTIKHELIKVDK